MTRRVVQQPTGEIILTLESEERHLPYGDFGLTFDSTDAEVIEAVAPMIEEEVGVDIREDNLYTVKSVQASQNKYLFAKSPAGI